MKCYNLINVVVMILEDSKKALELSLLPAVLASSCCLTIPSLALLGISFSENIFYEYRYVLRMSAIALMVISLIIFFYLRGVRNKKDILREQKKIMIITAQTFVFAVLIYIIFLYLIAPQLCALTNINSCVVY